MKKRRKPSVQKRIVAARNAVYFGIQDALFSAREGIRRRVLDCDRPLAERHIDLLRFDSMDVALGAMWTFRKQNATWFGDEPPANGKP